MPEASGIRATVGRILGYARWYGHVAPCQAGDHPSRADQTSRRNLSQHRIVIDVETPDSGYLVLNDPYHPWWFAQVDGQETKILQANVLFRAVAVPAGRHRARFTFRPLMGAWRQFASRLR